MLTFTAFGDGQRISQFPFNEFLGTVNHGNGLKICLLYQLSKNI